MIRLIALDVDGTLLTPEGQITQATKDAIAQAREQGVKVVLATGRSGQETSDFARQAGCNQLAVSLSGALIVDTDTGYHVRRWDIQHQSGRKALELCLNKDIQLMIFAGDQIVLDPFSKQSQLKTFPFEVFHNTAVVVDDPLAYLEEQQLPLTKIHGDLNPEVYPLAEFDQLAGVEYTRSNDHDFELVPAGVNKGRALALLALMYDLALEDCAAVGDSDNDLAMLRAVGYPVAMGNGAQSVKDVAKFVTDTNREEGVAKAILHILEQNRKQQ